MTVTRHALIQARRGEWLPMLKPLRRCSVVPMIPRKQRPIGRQTGVTRSAAVSGHGRQPTGRVVEPRASPVSGELGHRDRVGTGPAAGSQANTNRTRHDSNQRAHQKVRANVENRPH